MDFRVKCDKNRKGCNYTVKNLDIVKFCQIVELCKNFEKYVSKRFFFISNLKVNNFKCNLKLEKSNFKK